MLGWFSLSSSSSDESKFISAGTELVFDEELPEVDDVSKMTRETTYNSWSHP